MTGDASGAVAAGGRRRVFFALWPSPEVQARLADRARALQQFAGGRAMRADSLHLTLAFPGDVPAAAVPAIDAAGALATFEPFDLVLDDIGWFRAKRLAWAGPRALPAPLATLAATLRDALAAAAVPIDPQPFVAHVTLVRNALRIVEQPALAPVHWPVRDYALVESVPADGHRVYRILARRCGR